MKEKVFIASLIFVFSQLSVFSQNNILAGIVTMSDQPVRGLTVYTSFGTTRTDDLGRYTLPLNACAACRPGEKISIYTNHEEYGSSEQMCTIPGDYRYNFSIARNPSNLIITGMVKNSGANGEALANIEVKVLGIEFEMAPVKTNDFGEFKIPIRKDILPNKNAVLLQASDPQKRYKPLHTEPEYYNISAFAIIKMEPKISYGIQVSGFTRTRVCVKEGDAVSIDASGFIRIGAFAGNSDPDGRTSGVMGLSLERYNIVQEFNHAALMYRFTGDDEWKVAGKKKRFIAPHDGCIEFQINDNSQDDNSGAYEVEISIQ